MATAKSTMKSGLCAVAEPLICVCLKSMLNLPVEEAVGWLKKHFTDHSRALPKAIAKANDRAWQAVGLALAGDSLFEKIRGRLRDADMKAARDQIRAFVTDADSGLESATNGLRMRACDELNRMQREGLLGADDVEFTSLDMAQIGSSAQVADDAHRAVSLIAGALETDYPSLAQVLTLTPPRGGTPLLAAAFSFFLGLQIATNPELFCELTTERLRWLTLKQQAGFENLERSFDSKWTELFEMLGGWFATTNAELADIKTKVEQILEAHQVSKKPESPLRISVTSEHELQQLKKLRDRLREQPAELVGAELQSLLGDSLAAAGQFADAEKAHGAAANTAHQLSDRTAEAEAAYKQFKDACELRSWESALVALNRAIALDEKRFRPVPKHYRIDSILGAGAFGVVFKCRNSITLDESGSELVLAVKTIREADLDRPLIDVFAEANILKNLSHENIIRVIEHGYADPEKQQRPFLAMEYFPGITLEEYLSKHGKVLWSDFVNIFRQIADALHAAHSGKRSIIHRDLKPANVMVLKVNGSWQVKVIDFGLAVGSTARSTSRNVPISIRNSRDKSIVGTIKYAAPEQLGEKYYPIAPYSDVFAFGKTALVALFGTTDPKTRHWEMVAENNRAALKKMLERCTEEDLGAGLRLESFAAITKALKLNQPKNLTTTPVSPPVVTSHIDWAGLEKQWEPTPSIPPTAPWPTQQTLAPAPANPIQSQAGSTYEVILPGSVKMTFAWCPPGTFFMGSENERSVSHERPVHQVTLTKGFFAGIYPVTQAQWLAVMGGNPSHSKGDQKPVERVCWDRAQSFCQMVQHLTRIPARLPTEAEWEYACRAGSGTDFWNGNGEEAMKLAGWFDGNSNRQTQPVGMKYENPWGLFDVHGNVWEWCQDWYDTSYYQSSPVIDPSGPDGEHEKKVIRGGSWGYSARFCRAAYRLGFAPGCSHYGHGFRIVFDLYSSSVCGSNWSLI